MDLCSADFAVPCSNSVLGFISGDDGQEVSGEVGRRKLVVGAGARTVTDIVGVRARFIPAAGSEVHEVA